MLILLNSIYNLIIIANQCRSIRLKFFYMIFVWC